MAQILAPNCLKLDGSERTTGGARARFSRPIVLATVIPDMEALVGNTIERILTDKGCPRPQCATRLQVQGLHLRQKRGVTPKIKRELRRRSAVELVIGHFKGEHVMSRNYLWFRQGDANNAVLAAVGYNFRRLRWLRILLHRTMAILFAELLINPAGNPRSHGRLKRGITQEPSVSQQPQSISRSHSALQYRPQASILFCPCSS